MVVFAILLPTVDPVSLALEVVPSSSSSSSRSGWPRSWRSAGTSPRSARAGRSSEGSVRGLGAPGRGSADRERRGGDRGRGASQPSGRSAISAPASTSPRRDRAGDRQRPLASGVRGLRGLRRRALVRAVARNPHRAEGADRPAADGGDRDGSAPRSASRPGSRPSAMRPSPERPRTACTELGLRAIVYLEVFGSDPAEAMQQFEEKAAYVADALSPTGCRSACRRTPPTRARPRCTKPAWPSACR